MLFQEGYSLTFQPYLYHWGILDRSPLNLAICPAYFQRQLESGWFSLLWLRHSIVLNGSEILSVWVELARSKFLICLLLIRY